jgi:hypothetical protein
MVGRPRNRRVVQDIIYLPKSKGALASWESAIKIYEMSAKHSGSSGCRTQLYQEKGRFLSVAHLWGAWSIREGKFGERPEVGYDGWADFQYFLTEAEILRDFGQNWRPSRAKSEPPLPADVWRVPSSWEQPARRDGWPSTGMLPDLALPDGLIAAAKLKPAGRPPSVR